MGFAYGRYALVVAVAAGALAATAHARYLEGLQQTEPVVVVAREVEPFAMLSEADLRVEQRPAGSAGPEVLHDIAQATGRYARGLMLPGDILRQVHLAEVEGGHLATRLSAAGDPALRAMAVTVESDTGVANTLQPGDRVDVLVSVSVETDTYSKIIAQSVPVLHTTADPSQTEGDAGATVVLQVSPELAEEIAFAQGSGSIWLLAAPQGANRHQTAGMDLALFREKYGLIRTSEEGG